MNRKQFIQTVLGATAITTAAVSCNTKKQIVKGTIIGAASNIGHLLRAAKEYTIATTVQKKGSDNRSWYKWFICCTTFAGE